MTRLSDDDFDADVIDEARARDAEWFEDESPSGRLLMGMAVIALLSSVMLALMVLVLVLL